MIEPALVEAAISEAQESGLPVSRVPLENVAARAGISRSTLFRRIGSRNALEAAVAASGVDPGLRSVRDRATAAAVELLTEQGLGGLTLEAVANRADCSYGALHAQFGGREGLLSATFADRSPVADMIRVLETAAERPFEVVVGELYDILHARVAVEGLLLPAMVAEALTHPESTVGSNFRNSLGVRMRDALARWLRREARAGRCEKPAPDVALELLLSPLVAGVLLALPPPSRSDRAALVRAFCAAVGATGR